MKDLILGIILVAPIIIVTIFLMIDSPALTVGVLGLISVGMFFAGATKLTDYFDRRR